MYKLYLIFIITLKYVFIIVRQVKIDRQKFKRLGIIKICFKVNRYVDHPKQICLFRL